MTVDREVAELLRDDPDLLAVADAIATTHERRRSHTPRLVVAAAAIVLAVGLAVIAPWHGHGGSVIDQALAAVGTKPVLHAVIEINSPQFTILDLKTGTRSPVTQTEEYWSDPGRNVLRVKSSLGGRTVSDRLLLPRPGLWPPVVNNALQLFASGYRQALSNGKAQEVGRGNVDGQRVVFVTIDFGTAKERVAIDAKSYRPVLIEVLDATGKPEPVAWHVRAIETRPRARADFVAAPLPPSSGGRVTPLAAIHAEHAARVLGWTPVWLGKSFGGLPLRAVQPVRLTAAFGPAVGPKSGVVLSYVRGATRILVQEARSPGWVNGFRPWNRREPPGRAFVTRRSGFNPALAMQSICTAQLQVAGVWATVTASKNSCALAARALVPIGSPLVHRPTAPIPVTPVRLPPTTRNPSPAVCASAWNEHASAKAHRAVARNRPRLANVGADRPAGCSILFFLAGNRWMSAFGAVVNGTVPAWRGPVGPTDGRQFAASNASVSGDGTVHLRP